MKPKRGDRVQFKHSGRVYTGYVKGKAYWDWYNKVEDSKFEIKVGPGASVNIRQSKLRKI